MSHRSENDTNSVDSDLHRRDSADSERSRVPIRRVEWFPELGNPRWYLVSVLSTPVAVVLGYALAIAGAPIGTLILPLVLVFAAYFEQYDMLFNALGKHRREYLGMWALRAQLWLLFGGAVKQALGALRDTSSPTPSSDGPAAI